MAVGGVEQTEERVGLDEAGACEPFDEGETGTGSAGGNRGTGSLLPSNTAGKSEWRTRTGTLLMRTGDVAEDRETCRLMTA